MAVHSNSIPFLLMLALVASGSQGANILGLFTSLSPSHLVIQMSMAKILAESGHNVTVVTALKPPLLHPSVNHIQVPLDEADGKSFGALVADMAKRDTSNAVISMLVAMGSLTSAFGKMADVLRHQKVKDLYEHTDNHFDLVIVGYFMNSLQLSVAHKLKVPQIVALSNPPSLLGSVLGNPSEISYVPSMNLIVKRGQPMTFVQRVQNIFATMGSWIFMRVIEHNNDKIYKDLYGDDPSMPRYEDLYKNISLILFSSHGISEGPIRPNVPAVIEVGGIQVKDQPDPLPENIEDFLNSASSDDGAIFLSLGSNVKAEHIKSDTVQKMFNVISKLKQKVIWKWDNLENTPGKSENILYAKWLPQDDILAHPKIRLFITHAGKGGVTEAQYHGKPMLALPVFGDQPGNAAALVTQGFGLSLSLLTLEEQSFRDTIHEILENPKYNRAVKAFSSLYRDRPLSARQTLLYWVDYVIRHHGAAHLQSPVVHMGFVAAYNLDIYALLLALLFVIYLCSKLVFCGLYRKLFSNKSKSHPKQKSKKQKKQ
ncbi:UDP-glucuronosyltransferase 1-7C-like [Drosophila pseudoobscura]|uniref:UDP-glucuronosyltransferase 1-7C-like n=1 Tax=Drosophila pseudoobscura pseudoobscura TaxID=46245 RepID=A0A6I8UI28_DROPS|nr:UDP-glucuronosyltransferase 1-7C [Drosophila pseudoobscura]